MKQVIQEINNWLQADDKNYEQGCNLLLRITRNAVQYGNLIRAGRDRGLDFVTTKLTEHYNRLLLQVNKEVYNEAAGQAEAAVADLPNREQRGKRPDHDKLPDEIQALYVENLSLLQQMRELHLQIRNTVRNCQTCTDNERYPLVKAIIDLDKRYHQNWKAYDSYNAQ